MITAAPPTPETLADDQTLLADFARTRDEKPFRTLVDRHAPWVYAAAFRQLKNHAAAEDAAQAVFVLLCQRAARLQPNQKLAGWLFMTLQFTVRGIRRAQRRRQFHESQAINPTPNPTEDPLALQDDLDAAVAQLAPADRLLILHRFYEGLDFPALARTLGTSESTARKRVTRAVERLRKLLGPAATPQHLATAAIVGIPAATITLSAKFSATALAATAGHAALTAGTAAALKGATSLMTLAKMKITAIITTAVIVGITAGATLQTVLAHPDPQPQATPQAPRTIPPAPRPPPPASANTAPQPDPATFEQIYALKDGDIIRRVMPPFSPTRLEHYRRTDPSQAEAIPRGPDGMLIHWKDGKLSPWGQTFGSGQGYSASQLIEYYLKVFGPEIEGAEALKSHNLPGDFVVREGATIEQYRAVLEKIFSEDLNRSITLTFREVDRSVHVLKGKWQYAPLEVNKSRSYPQIEIYGRDLNQDMSRGGGGGGTPAELAGWISRRINQQILMEGTELPNQLRWHENDGNGTAESRNLSRDPTLILRHLSEQTGLTATLETRKVKRLFIEAK